VISIVRSGATTAAPAAAGNLTHEITCEGFNTWSGQEFRAGEEGG
jgi:hypothetical protein